MLNVIQKPEMIHCVTTKLYPEVAKELNTTTSKIERSARNAIKSTFDKNAHLGQAYPDRLNYYFRTNKFSNITPTNSEFITMIADSMQANHSKLVSEICK